MITKMEAAETQLETAIKLFFENRDHLSCLTLAAASREITDDLCEKQKNKIYKAELERLGDPQKVRLSFREELKIFIKPEHWKEAKALFRKPQNFLKHADKDHDQKLEKVSSQQLALDIMFAIKNFVLLGGKFSPAMAIFYCWFAAANPSLVRRSGKDDDPFDRMVTEARATFQDFDGYETLNIIYEGLKVHVAYLFTGERRT